jgi:hypothetical protein
MPKISLKMGHKEETINHYSRYIEWNVACPKRKAALSGHRKKIVGLGDSECLVLGRKLLSLILGNRIEAAKTS